MEILPKNIFSMWAQRFIVDHESKEHFQEKDQNKGSEPGVEII